MKNKRVITGTVFAVVVAAFILPAAAVHWITAIILTVVAQICAKEYTMALKSRFGRHSFGMTLVGT